MARIKYYDTITGEWKHADSQFNIGSDQNATITPVLYVATEYGIIPEASADNTKAMQELIQKVHDDGGGIIWLPVGTYGFDRNSADRKKITDNFQMCIEPMSKVSIIGESITETVIKVYGTNSDTAWMANQVDKNADDVALYGFTYQNFTVDMSDSFVSIGSDGNIKFSSAAKAFGMKALKNCVFRDLRILESPATGFGIDMLDNVVVDSLYIYKCGKQWEYGSPGGAGIGIGTGRWEQENFIVRNCICVECGHFGIFLEDQGIFNDNMLRNDTMGQIIANNVIHDGKHYGIGVRGGQNVVVTGNNVYNNKGGIYMDYGAQRIMVSNNAITENTEAGLMFGIEDAGRGDYACEKVSVSGNSFFNNKLAISIMRQPIDSKIKNNIYIGNDIDMFSDTPIDIDESKIKKGVYINDAGQEAANTASWLYDEFIDLDTTHVTWTPIGKTETGNLKNPRIAVYGENKEFLCRMNDNYQPDNLRTDIEAKLASIQESRPYRYIKFGDNCNGDILTSLRLHNKIAEEESTDTQDKFMLTDEVTGIKYKLSISDGKLTMTEVTA